MSEKRFEKALECYGAWDTKTNEKLYYDDIIDKLNELTEDNERLKANNDEQFIKLLICIALSNRGWIEEEIWFMKQLEKKYFPEDD